MATVFSYIFQIKYWESIGRNHWLFNHRERIMLCWTPGERWGALGQHSVSQRPMGRGGYFPAVSAYKKFTNRFIRKNPATNPIMTNSACIPHFFPAL